MAASEKRATMSEAPQPARRDMRDNIWRLNLEAAQATLPAKVDQTLRHWFSRHAPDMDTDEGLREATLATAIALELESFTPSHSGSTAIDRLTRRRKLDADEQIAQRALAAARFTVIRVERDLGDDLYTAEDLATGRDLVLYDDEFPPAAHGFPLSARVAMLDQHISITVGTILPLDEAGVAVAMEFVRPGRGIPHGHRCAAAVYKHVMRHGGPKIEGLNVFSDDALSDGAPSDDDFDENAPISPFDFMVAGLVAGDQWMDPPQAIMDEVRNLVSSDAIRHCLFRAVTARKLGDAEPGTVFRRFAAAMIEALHLRALAGSGLERAPLDRLSQMIDREVATNGYPSAAADLFRDIRIGLSTTKPRQAGDELTRVIERIRALRAKTVDQGCTEEEALAAADKVAELLDRYGLSLGETELRHQACLGVGIDSNRKRMGPLDDCVPAVAQFCDCRAWHERTPAGTIRCMFFGLPADVEAAQYLFERVAMALDTETTAFKKSDLYQGLAGGGRQKATSSFQLGLSRGISRKLDARKSERDAKTFQVTGRDLVPVKASVVEDELAKLGLSFTYKDASSNRLVLLDAFEAGQIASGRFEIQSEIEQD